MLIRPYNSDLLTLYSIRFFSAFSVFLSLLILLSFEFEYSLLNTVSGVFFLLTTSLLCFNKRFMRSPFALPLCYFTLIFINIPAAYILLQGNEYIFGTGVSPNPLPYLQNEYHKSVSSSFLFLSICWISLWAGIVCATKASNLCAFNKNEEQVYFSIIFVLGLFVFLLHTSLFNEFVSGYKGYEIKAQSKLGVLFGVHAFLALSSIILFRHLNSLQYLKKKYSAKVTVTLIFILFLYYQYSSGGKAAIMQISATFFLVPISLSRDYVNSKVYFLSFKAFILITLLSPILFYITYIQRLNFGSDIVYEYSLLDDLFSLDDIAILFKKIILRLSQGGIDRYILIFKSFIGSSYDYSLVQSFLVYIAKNTVNLTFPGTPFPEAYAPSGQHFYQVINHNFIGWNFGKDPYLLTSNLNTSTYTVIGESIIFFGIFAPIALFILSFSYVRLYYCFTSLLIKGILALTYLQVLSSYGIDGTFGDSFNLMISMILMYLLLKSISMILALNTRVPLGR